MVPGRGWYTGIPALEANRVSEIRLPSWDEVEAEAVRLALDASAAELHGALSGWLAAGGKDLPGWIAEVMADPA